jgi:hypothetical protein
MIDFSGLKDLFGQQSFPFGAPAAMAPNAPVAPVPAQASGTWGQPPVPGAPPPPAPVAPPAYPDHAPYAAPEMRVAAAPGEAGPMGPAVPEGLLAKSPLPPGAPAIPVLGGAESVGPPMPPATGVPSSPASAAAPSGFQKLMNDPEFGKSVGQLVKAAGGGKHAPMPAMQAPGGGGGGANPGARQGAAELFQAILQSRAPHPLGGVPQFTPRRF